MVDRPLTDLQVRVLIALDEVCLALGEASMTDADQVLGRLRADPTNSEADSKRWWKMEAPTLGRVLYALFDRGYANRRWQEQWAMWKWTITDDGRKLLRSMGD